MTEDQPTPPKPIASTGHWYAQPIKVYALCFVYCIERASIYGIRYGLVLWLVQTWEVTDVRATTLFGAFTFFIFAAHAVAGTIADSGWGFIKASRLGLILLIIGYALFGYTFEAAQDFSSTPLFVLSVSLALISSGTGLVRIGCFNLVGLQYQRGDTQSAVAYTLYYWLESIGIMLAAIIAGTIVPFFGYSATFSCAAGVFLLVFVLSWFVQHTSVTADLRDATARTKGRFSFQDATQDGTGVAGRSVLLTIIMLAVFSVFGLFPEHVWILVVAAIGYATLFVHHNRLAFSKAHISRYEIQAFLFLTFFSLIYTILLEQQMSSILLFADRFVDLQVFGQSFGASNVLVFNPITIIIVTPIIAFFVARTAKHGNTVRWSAQYALAFSLAAGGFLVLVLGATNIGDATKVALPFLLVTICIAAIGDALIYPPAFVALSRVSPPKAFPLQSESYFRISLLDER